MPHGNLDYKNIISFSCFQGAENFCEIVRVDVTPFGAADCCSAQECRRPVRVERRYRWHAAERCQAVNHVQHHRQIHLWQLDPCTRLHTVAANLDHFVDSAELPLILSCVY